MSNMFSLYIASESVPKMCTHSARDFITFILPLTDLLNHWIQKLSSKYACITVTESCPAV